MDDKENQEKISIPEEKDLKARCEKLKLKIIFFKKVQKIFCAILFIFGISLFVLAYYHPKNMAIFHRDDAYELMYVFGVSSLLFSAVYYILFEYKEGQLKARIVDCECRYIQQKVEDDLFENSIKMSYKYLDQYYAQTREQAQRGFIITVIVSIFGAFLIAIGVLAMFFGKTDPSYITCGAGVITEFISAIFFYLYNKTVERMSDYHNKLVLSHNVSIALKVSDSLDGNDEAEAKNLIISELLKNINTHLISSDADCRQSTIFMAVSLI